MKCISSTMMITLLLASSLAFVACERRDGTPAGRGDRSTANINRDRTSDNGAENRKDEYENRIQARLDQFDKQIDRIKSKVRDTDNENVKNGHERVLNELNMKKEAAEKMLANIKSANVDSWQNMRNDMDNAVDDLASSFDKAGYAVGSGAVASTGRDRVSVKDGSYDNHDGTTARKDVTSNTETDRKHAYENKMEARLDEFDNRIDRLQSNMKDVRNGSNKVTNDALVDRLKLKNEIAHKILDHIKSADEKAWVAVKPDLEHAISDLENTFNKAGIHSKSPAVSNKE